MSHVPVELFLVSKKCRWFFVCFFLAFCLGVPTGELAAFLFLAIGGKTLTLHLLDYVGGCR